MWMFIFMAMRKWFSPTCVTLCETDFFSSRRVSDRGMKEYFRVERLTRHVSTSDGVWFLPHSPSSYCADRHGSLLQRPAFPGNLFCVNAKARERVRHADHGNWKGICRIQYDYFTRNIFTVWYVDSFKLNYLKCFMFKSISLCRIMRCQIYCTTKAKLTLRFMYNGY